MTDNHPRAADAPMPSVMQFDEAGLRDLLRRAIDGRGRDWARGLLIETVVKNSDTMLDWFTITPAPAPLRESRAGEPDPRMTLIRIDAERGFFIDPDEVLWLLSTLARLTEQNELLCARIQSLLSERERAENEQESLTAERAAATTGEAVRMFPIMGGPAIPWSAIAPFEGQAQENHGQTLERLAERGGLSVGEAIHILECVEWHRDPRSKEIEAMPKRDAILHLTKLAAPAPQVAALTEERDRGASLTAQADQWFEAYTTAEQRNVQRAKQIEELESRVASLSAALEACKGNAVHRVGCARHNTTVEGCQYCRRVAASRRAALPAGDAPR